MLLRLEFAEVKACQSLCPPYFCDFGLWPPLLYDRYTRNSPHLYHYHQWHYIYSHTNFQHLRVWSRVSSKILFFLVRTTKKLEGQYHDKVSNVVSTDYAISDVYRCCWIMRQRWLEESLISDLLWTRCGDAVWVRSRNGIDLCAWELLGLLYGTMCHKTTKKVLVWLI